MHFYFVYKVIEYQFPNIISSSTSCCANSECICISSQNCTIGYNGHHLGKEALQL